MRELVRLSHTQELKSMLSGGGPCVSLYFPVSRENLNPADDEKRWKQAVRKIESQVAKFGARGRELAGSLMNWAAVSEDRTGKDKTLVVFRSSDFFYRVWLRASLDERIVTGPQFFIRPLLPYLRDPVFYILALSLNDVRLLRCTLNSAEQIPLGTETNFENYIKSANPDQSTPPIAGKEHPQAAANGLVSGTLDDSEDRREFVAHYFRQINRAVNTALRETQEPVVPVGVDHELAIYRSVNTYPRLTEGIHGAPNGLKGGEMHTRALDLLERRYVQEIKKILGEYNHLAGGGRATNRLKEIVTAAHDGRVNKLVISDSQQHTGYMDEATHQVSGSANGNGGEDYDLVNDAAVQTILHAGQVFAAPHKLIPNGSPLAAIFRY